MAKKEKKGIGCSAVFILLPIPCMMIYGLASDNFELFEGFLYGCVISLVFLIFTLISARKQKKARREEEAIAEKYDGAKLYAPAAGQSAAQGSPKASKKRFCAECGAELVEGAKFCKKCGAAVAVVTGGAVSAPAAVADKNASPKKPQSRASVPDSAKRGADVMQKILAQLTDRDVSASAVSGEMSVPATQAQNAFLNLIAKD